jgi:voltage-gated potassium channel
VQNDPFDNKLIRFRRRLQKTSDRLYALVLIACVIVVGTLGFAYFEGWSLFQALYTTIITVTTVGYGDFTPQTQSGQIFAIFFTLSAIGIASYAFSTMAAFVINREQERRASKIQELRMKRISSLSDHVLVCGGGHIGGQVARAMRRANTPVIIIEPDEKKLRQALLHTSSDFMQDKIKMIKTQGYASFNDRELEDYPVEELADDLGVPILREDPTLDNTLLRAGIERARGLTAALNDDKETLFTVLSARQLAKNRGNPDLNIVVRIFDESSRSKMISAGANQVTSLASAGGIQMSTAVLEPDLANFWLDAFFQEDVPLQFSTLKISGAPHLVGQSIAVVSEQRASVVLAVKRNQAYQYLPADSMRLEPDDLLILLAPI